MSALRVPVGLGFQGVLSNRRVSSFGPPLSTLIEPSESNEHWWVTKLSGAASFAIPDWCERITLCCVRTNRHAWVAARVMACLMVASETAVQERAMLHGSDRGARFTLIEKVWRARLGRTERLAP